MQAPPGHTHFGPTDAATRLRYLNEVQQRTRRAAFSPVLGLLCVGAIVIAHGLVVTVWPHASLEWVVWVAALVAVRPLMRWLRHRVEQKRGVVGERRVRLASAGAAVGFAVLALVTGANSLVSGVAAATALMAYLASMPLVSLTVVGIGLAGDLAIRQGVPVGTAQLLVGAALLALALAISTRKETSHEPSH
jgi:hypothetical protein